jgi:hypothetical protein
MTKEQLFPDDLRGQLPGINATRGERDRIVWAKFFYPDFEWTWYAIEFDGEDTFYGLVDGVESEFGCFSLSELLENRGTMGFDIERDLTFTPRRVSELFPEL